MKSRIIIGLGILVAMLAGCAPQQETGAPGSFGWNKTTGGTILGAIGGGLAGAQFGHGSGKLAATALGTIAGAFIGNQVGSSLDRADQEYMHTATTQAYTAPVGQAIAWRNPQSGHFGTITPIRQGTDSSGRYCREFQQTVTIGGNTQQAYGTACRQPDGSWQIVSNP